jgi:hypothetical protein
MFMTKDDALHIEEAGIEEVYVRSPMTAKR